MIGSALTAWLKEEDLTRSAIGLFGVIFGAYSVNFLWSPLLDRYRTPLMGIKRLGLRRGWVYSMQLAIALCCLIMSTFNVQQDLFFIALFGLFIAIFSATQDIAIDAFRIDSIPSGGRETMSAASAAATAGWWTGYGGLGAIPFFIADLPNWQWSDIYLILGGIMLLLGIPVLLAKEPNIDRDSAVQSASRYYNAHFITGNKHSIKHQISNWLMVTLFEPFREFFSRNGTKFALSVLLFIFLFKMGEAFLGRMSIVFYKEVGFSNTDIGTYSKLFNWWVTILFAGIGGLVNIRYGIYRGLMISGIAMASSNLMFAAIAMTGPNIPLFIATIFVDGFTTAWSSVAMVAFISLMCNKAFSATQYALMASLGVLGRTVLASASGFIVDGMDGNWVLFFIITSVMVTPGLVFLWRIKHHVEALEQR
ncbi:MFS transporter [Alteromonas sp. a30]|nr:MFS transporter [Alteromonas sp. a30]